MATRVLIVAYGNPLRCDDGVAWRAADALEDKFPESEVEIIRLHQLTPEVADSVRDRALVLFLDAACIDDVKNSRAGEIRVREMPNEEIRKHPSGQFSHVYSPAKVLDLARELYHVTPNAFVLTVAGEDFGHGDCLSTPVANSLPELIGTVEDLVKNTVSTATSTKDTDLS